MNLLEMYESSKETGFCAKVFALMQIKEFLQVFDADKAAELVKTDQWIIIGMAQYNGGWTYMLGR